jgi:hypothetical protein
MPERLERRLTTILAADFAEHGRLMRADEDGDPNQEFFADGVAEDMITRCPIPVRHRAPRNATSPTQLHGAPPISTSVSTIFAALAHEQPAPNPDAPRVTITTLF